MLDGGERAVDLDILVIDLVGDPAVLGEAVAHAQQALLVDLQPHADHRPVAVGRGKAGERQDDRSVGEVRVVLDVGEGDDPLGAGVEGDLGAGQGQQREQRRPAAVAAGGEDPGGFPRLGPLELGLVGADELGKLVDQDAAVVGRPDALGAPEFAAITQRHQIDGALVVEVVHLRPGEGHQLVPSVVVDVDVLTLLEHGPDLGPIQVAISAVNDVDHTDLQL